MKKIILCWAFLLVPTALAWGQSSTPADTSPPPTQQTVPVDTMLFQPQEAPPADTPAVTPPAVDTGSILTPVAPAAPADTGKAPAPADTGAAAPPKIITPVEPETTPAPPAPTEAGAEGGDELATGQGQKIHRVALGIVFNDEAPLSIRAWFNPKVGLDAGLGLVVRTVEDITATVPSPESTTTFLDLSFDLGLPVRVMRYEKVDLIVRPGFGFRTRPGFFTAESDPSVRSVETSLELEVNGSLGFEYYPFERASFGLVAGIALVANRTGGSGNTIIQVKSLPSEKGVNFAFRYYTF